MLFNSKITPIWILAVPRSGSSFLVDFLNRTNLFNPKFREFNLDLEKKEQILFNLPKYIKLQRIFFEFKGFCDYDDKNKILKKYPNIKFIITQRKNIYEQTVSTYFAEYSKKWSINNKKELEKYKKLVIPYNEKELIRLFKRNYDHINCWDNFVQNTNYIKVNYEEITNNYYVFFKKICNFIKLKIEINKNIDKISLIKLQRKETKEYVEKLKKIIES